MRCPVGENQVLVVSVGIQLDLDIHNHVQPIPITNHISLHIFDYVLKNTIQNMK